MTAILVIFTEIAENTKFLKIVLDFHNIMVYNKPCAI